MGLSLEPEPTSGPARFAVILTIVVLGLVFLWWRQNSLAHQPSESASGLVPTATIPADTPSPAPQTPDANGVSLVYSAVVNTDTTPALTADLYLAEAEHPDPGWSGVMGRTAVETYTVQSGDTLWGIATKFGLDVDTLRWSNPSLEHNPDLLSPGTDLTILPVIGAYYTVQPGDTVAKIAESFGVAEADITNYPPNELSEPFTLKPGQTLIIPNGRKNITPAPPPDLDADYPLAWPLRGIVTQGYIPGKHLAIDIGAPYGSTVYAAADGTVIHAQWARTGYGFTVIIDHGGGLQTLYAHLKGTLVSSGDTVSRGQAIGAVGSTGNSTGPHVHFEVRENRQRMNPLDYLKPR